MMSKATKENQSKKRNPPRFGSVEDYLASVDRVKAGTLRSVIDFILAEFPELESKISWTSRIFIGKGNTSLAFAPISII